MKRNSYFLLALIIISFASCSQDENMDNNLGNTKEATTNFGEVFKISTDGNAIPDVVFQSNNEGIIWGNPNSEYWVDDSEKMTKSSSGTITVTGYTSKTAIKDKNYKVMFTTGYHDKNVNRSTVYLAEYFRYRKLIEIPKGYTPILPPPSIMLNMPNMGMIPPPPSEQQQGYQYEFYKTVNGKDQYYLVTDVVEVLYDIQGRQMWSTPLYMPYNVTNPSTMTFKYQYDDIDWSK